jgi:recombination protein RecA
MSEENNSDIASKLKKLESLMVKKYGDNYYGINNNNSTPASIRFISTGCFSIDYMLGGGLPEGRIVQMYGPESSGKSLISTQFIKSLQEQGKICALIDSEAAYDTKFASMCGVDVNNLMLLKPSSAEESLEAIRDLVKSEVVDLIVLDSISGLLPKETQEKKVDESTMAIIARYLSKILPELAVHADRNKCTIVLINQVRATMQMYGPSESPTGGNALKYWSSVIIRISKQVIKEAGKEIGIVSTLKTVKNKCAIPFATAEIDILFPYTAEDGTQIAGIDILKDIIRQGIRKEIIIKKGAWYEYQNLKVQGEQSLKAELENNPEVLTKLKEEMKYYG